MVLEQDYFQPYIGYSTMCWESFLAMDTFISLYSHFCLELALEIWAKASWYNLFCFMTLTMPTL